eukprot:m51a1_g10822 hypothetical protein (614) ;mRNA; f:2653-5384
MADPIDVPCPVPRGPVIDDELVVPLSVPPPPPSVAADAPPCEDSAPHEIPVSPTAAPAASPVSPRTAVAASGVASAFAEQQARRRRRGKEQSTSSVVPTPSTSPMPLRDLPQQRRLDEPVPLSPSDASERSGRFGGLQRLGGSVTPPPLEQVGSEEEVAEDSEDLGAIHAAIACNLVFTICGMLFVFANLISTVTIAIVSGLIYTRRRVLGRVLLGLTLVCGVVSAVGGVVSFGIAVWVIASEGFRQCMYYWGVALIPATYPLFAAYLAASTLALWRVRQAVRLESLEALRRVTARQESLMRCYRILNHKVVAAPPEQAQIVVHIAPDQRVRQHMVRELGVDENVLLDSLDATELARAEFRNGHMAAVVKLPHMYRAEDNHFFRVDSCGLFLFANRLIVVLHESFPLFEGRVFTSVDSLHDVVIRLMHRFTCCFEDHLRMINSCSEELEREIELSTDNGKLMHLFTLEKSLVYHLNAINSNGRVITRMQTRLELNPANTALLEEVAVENAQCNKMATIYSQVISGLMDARASIISNNLNIMMKNLNSIVIAIAVPSFFAGVGGMSEFSGLFDFERWWRVAYPMFIVAMLVLGILVFVLLRYTENLWAGTKRTN